MNVLYDITQLAYGQQDASMRTGIFRAIEEVARRIPFLPECEVRFSSASHMLNHAIEYVGATPKIQHIPVTTTAPSRRPIEEKLEHAYGNQKHGGATGVLDKIRIKGLFVSSKLAQRFPYQNDTLQWSDIFHTPCHPIPSDLRGYRKLNRFQTIYDLWPVLCPVLSTEHQVEFVHSLIGALQVDDWVITDSQSAKDDLCNFRADIDPNRVFVAHLAADTAKFHPVTDALQLAAMRSRYRIPPGKPYFLSLCTLEPRKNLNHVVRCFAALAREPGVEDVHLVLAGGKGWLSDGVFKGIAEVPEAIRERIILTGFVADEHLAALYSDALGFVFPSLYEGFGLPPLEAMQCGTPVLCSNTSSLPEVIGEAGILLDPKDQDGLCQSLLELCNKPEMHQALAVKSLARAARFSWERCAQETANAYKTALTTR